MKFNQSFLGLLHAVLWIMTSWALEAAFSATPARESYGLLCSWWGSLYIALLIGTTWRALPVFLALMVIAFVVDATLGAGFMYHDPPAVGTVSFLNVAGVLLLLWASPIFVNEAVVRIRRWLCKRDRNQA